MARYAPLIGICLLVTPGCTHQQMQGSSPAQRNPVAAAGASHLGYGSRDFVGHWKCIVTNGRYTVTTDSTIRPNGTAVGRGTAYGHTSPQYENSWSYAPSGADTGTMHDDNMAFRPPHYAATAAVTWRSADRFSMVAIKDTNPGGVGSKMECARAK